MIKVLDHGFVRLIDSMGSDLSVSRAARVSYDAPPREEDTKLIQYLKKNKHHTPFESVVFTFEVKAPIFVLRQWHRHRTWCLSGSTKLRFIRPADSKPYWKTIEEIHNQWNSETEVKRKDKQKRSLKDFNRDRISSMKLSCVESGNLTNTKIVDCWYSGEKEVFEIENILGDKIKASKDHQFLTTQGWKKLEDVKIGDEIYGIKNISSIDKVSFKPYSLKEFISEVWKETDYKNITVSSLGRVKRKNELLSPTLNKQNRPVISVQSGLGWKTVQVSRIVAETFLGKKDLHVLHNDDCSINNRLDNLRYGDDLQNHKDAKINGRRAINQVKPIMVKTIRSIGIEKTYDIEVEHSEHNFIAENFVVHNCYNELSARYRQLPGEMYVPAIEQITTQSVNNKQQRTDEQHPEAHIIRSNIRFQNEQSYEMYEDLLAKGCPRELARGVLPVNTYSHMFCTVNLLNLMRFLALRDHSHAQYEIRVYAEAMRELAKTVAPVSIAAFEEFGA